MADYDDYKQRMREKFERENKGGSGILGGFFQRGDSQRLPEGQKSDYELARELQEMENQNKNPSNAAQTTFDFRDPNNSTRFGTEMTRVQQLPKGSDIELSEYAAGRSQNASLPLLPRNEMQTQRSLEHEGFLTSWKNKISEQMSPIVKFFCILNGVFLFFIFIIMLKSI